MNLFIKLSWFSNVNVDRTNVTNIIPKVIFLVLLNLSWNGVSINFQLINEIMYKNIKSPKKLIELKLSTFAS